MKLNNKGFVSSTLMYSLLILFLFLILGLIALLSNRKMILDKLKNDIKKEVNSTKKYAYYDNGTAIYYNPKTGKVCSNYTSANSATGVTEGCLKFYIFNDDINRANVNMILDHNTTATVAYNSTGTNTEMKEVKDQLNTDTSTWKNEARLITADEIAKIVGADSNDTIKWKSSKTYGTNIETQSSYFYLDGSGSTYSGWQTRTTSSTNKSKYAWLFDYTDCSSYGCNTADSNTMGYWTNTSTVGRSNEAWSVIRSSGMSSNGVEPDNAFGIRPVINVSKKNLNTNKTESFVMEYDYTGSVQSFTVPVDGKYKLEVWGAQGGRGNPTANVGGKGGYSFGTIALEKDTILYIYVGQQGDFAIENSTFGGGGKAEESSTYDSGQGGGASDIRIEEDSLYARVIVAGGGGGGAGANETTFIGGYGGGLQGGSTISNSAGAKDTVSGASQTTAGASTVSSYNNSQLSGSFGVGGYYGGAGTRSGGAGGGGWYGGGAGSYGTAGSGGSGYVYTSETASNYPSGCLLSNKYYLINASTIDGNTSFLSPGGTDETGHSGNGYARITYLAD